MGESFQTLDFTGGANFSIPIPTPAARGIAPALSLSYHSGGGSGIFGLGFGVALSSIARKTSSGVPRYDATDIFILSEAGELVPARSFDETQQQWICETRNEPSDDPAWHVVAYRPRHEGSFAQIECWKAVGGQDVHWQVRTRDNVIHTYGRTENSRIADPDKPNRIFQWLIDETQDGRGNKIRYTYKHEDDGQLSSMPEELGRDHRSNRYISRIEYGNYWNGNDERFAFQVAFDYGEYSLADPETAPVTWALRPDPFSIYRSGFEIRTLRRCQAILIFHCFHDQYGGKPFLTRAMQLDYRQACAMEPRYGLSLVTAITESGFRRQDDGTYQSKALPPVTFSYADFDPAGQTFDELRVGGLRSLPGYLAQGQYMPVDLDGRGIPGFLYSDPAAILQFEPTGEGNYLEPSSPPYFPPDHDLANPELVLISLAGNGEKDLVVRRADRAGFYRYVGAGGWDSFQSFASVPVDLSNPAAEMVDMNGNGLADLVIIGEDRITSYPGLGLDGYGAADEAPTPPDFPVAEQGGQAELITFADLFGDGLYHRVRVCNGQVECWPNLGYGRFGAKVVFANAPTFGNELNASRLFLVDLDGSGAADLVYVDSDQIRIFFNQNGNRFSDPLTIRLPVPYDNLCQISFADINGNGTACLVLTRVSPDVTHHYYDFSGDLKPYLLTAIDNHLGAVTRIKYSTSVKQYMADKAAGFAWTTQLFFPVHVVDQVEHVDEIAGVRYVSRYKYHDGYYDPQEREFRGFGFIETWDTEDWDDYKAAVTAANVPLQDLSQDLYVPPTYTRSWFHRGAPGLSDRSLYWSGDPVAHRLPDSVMAAEIQAESGETVRQAHVGLAGQLLRREVYGLDASAASSVPYTVSESRFDVRLIQPKAEQPYAVFLVQPLETLNHEYDRNPADPRIAHELNLAVDAFGNVERSCAIAYPRRANPGTTVYPEQTRLWATLREQAFINHPQTTAEPFRWIGVTCESKLSELAGLIPTAGCFAFDELARQLDAALANRLDYEQAFTGQVPAARLSSWSRWYFWDAKQAAQLPLGATTAAGLLHHSEQAVATPALHQAAFPDADADTLSRTAGYDLDQGYWWNRGLVQYYLSDPARFCLPCQTDGGLPGVDRQSRLNPITVVSYDQYDLLPVSVTSYVRGAPAAIGGDPGDQAVVLTDKVDNDYRTLSPSRLVNANGVVTEALYDPLGMVIATTMFGTEDGRPAGDTPLARYQVQFGASFQDVIDNPAKYLQQSSSFFFYDLSAWDARKAPAAAVGLTRQLHVQALAPPTASPIEIGVAYSGGFGTVIEERRKSVSAGSDIWIVSGRTVYNNKGNPTEKYLPYFSAGPAYGDQPSTSGGAAALPPAVLRYDPLGRLIRSDNPKGFFSKVVFTPWAVATHDENDTVLDSRFYKAFPRDPATGPDSHERDALDKAAAFYNTPTIAIMDPLGRTVRSVQNNLGAVTVGALQNLAAASGSSPQQLWNDLVNDGLLRLDDTNPATAWPTDRLQPYDQAFQQAFRARYKDAAAPLLALLTESCHTTWQSLDVGGRPLRSIDPRLLYANATGGTDYYNFDWLYDMAGNALVTQSCDAGTRRLLRDVFGNVIDAWDGRGFHVMRQYDRLGRPTSVKVVGGDGVGKFASPVTTELMIYGEMLPDAAKRGLNGRLYQHYDPAGLVSYAQYGLAGAAIALARQLRPDYQMEADWTTQAMTALAAESAYTTSFTYDALGRVISEVTPDAGVTIRRYDVAGQLAGVETELAAGSRLTIVDRIDYDANGQRTRVALGNGVVTSYSYEDTTLRLMKIATTRPSQAASGTPSVAEILQDITSWYDPVGNLTCKQDNSWSTLFCYNQQVDPLCDYTYDAVYRLIHASGRQQPGRRGSPNQDVLLFCPPAAADQIKLENYGESYSHDAAGNLLAIRHTAQASWTRTMDVAANSNRLAGTAYDGNGNLAALDHLRGLVWNYRDSLARADLIIRGPNNNDSEFYLYDASGNRVLKVSERVKQAGGAGRAALTEIEETIYLGNFEIRRIKQRSAADLRVILERHTLSVTDDKARVCLLQHWVQDDQRRDVDTPGERRFRYQLDDCLGSVALELDETAQRISYQEFLPYGATAFFAAGSAVEVKRKQFGFSGKEQDGMTGLVYFGARYYPPWIGRWMNPDPAGPKDALNLYVFVGGNPTSRVESDGRIWGALAGAVMTLATGAAMAKKFGFAKGTTSGTIAGAVAGAVGGATAAVVGAAVGGTLATAALPAIGMAAATAAIASLASSVIAANVGGFLGEMAMDESEAPRTIAAKGTGVSGLVGAAIGIGLGLLTSDPTFATAAVAGTAGAGAAVVSSGAYLGFLKAEGITVNPVELTDISKIYQPPTVGRDGKQVPNLPNKMLIVMAPHDKAVERMEQIKKDFKGDVSAAYRLDPGKPYHAVNNPNLNLIAVHGMRGFVMVPTGPGGNVMRPMSIETFTSFVNQKLQENPGNYTGPLKFMSCFGGAVSPNSNAQVLASGSNRLTHAFPWSENPTFGSKKGQQWKEYQP